MANEEKKIVTINERTHPLYNKYLEEWNFYIESALGGKDYYENEENLFTHRLEDQAGDYQDRLERVYFLNFCNLVCSIYADYIFKEKIRRPPNDTLDSFRQNVDGRGTDINTFMNQVSYLSSVYGQVHVIVDAPYAEDLNIPLHFYKANKEQFDPYAVIVAPQDLRDWSVDELGNLNWVLIRSSGYEDADPLNPREDDTTFRLIARDYWAVFDAAGNELERREHKYGEVYMTTCYNSDSNIDLIGESLITDISRINRIIYNWCSNIDEMIERQTFSQLVMPDDPQSDLEPKEESGDPLRKVSTATIFTFPFNSSQPPQFISPDRQQIDVIWKMIQNHRDLIYELAGLGTVGSSSKFLSQRSGISQAYQFLSINSSLAKKASKLERVENEINRLVLNWKGQDNVEEKVEYPAEFDVLSLTETMETTFQIAAQNFSTTLNVELLKALARKAAPVLPEETLNEIYEEIDENSGTLMSPALALGPGFGGAFGGGFNQTPSEEGQEEEE
jgi:hypothetical protein